LEALFELLGEEDEDFAAFSERIRGDFDADDTAEQIESDIVVPDVPENCDESTKAAM
jgi:hypothetical protein